MTHHISMSDVHKGHGICDKNGDRIGTVKNVHQLGRAMGGQQPMGEGYVQCDCSVPGLSKELYIPFNAFRDCDGKCCYLNVRKDDLSRMGWEQKPSNL